MRTTRKAAIAVIAPTVALSAMAYVFLDFSQITAFFGFGDDVVLLENEYGEVLWEGKVIPPASSYIQDGLIAQWDGIENAGAWKHSSTTGTWVNLAGDSNLSRNSSATIWGEDCLTGRDRSYSVDGSSAMPMCTQNSARYALPLTTALTMELVLRNRNSSTFCLIVPTNGVSQTAGTLQFFYTNTSRGCQFEYVNASGCVISPSYVVGKDVYVAHTRNAGSTSFKAYVNGVNRNQSINRTAISADSYPRFGCGYNSQASNSYPYIGDVCAMRFYNRTLTAEEIAYNYALDKERFNLP